MSTNHSLQNLWIAMSVWLLHLIHRIDTDFFNGCINNLVKSLSVQCVNVILRVCTVNTRICNFVPKLDSLAVEGWLLASWDYDRKLCGNQDYSMPFFFLFNLLRNYFRKCHRNIIIPWSVALLWSEESVLKFTVSSVIFPPDFLV